LGSGGGVSVSVDVLSDSLPVSSSLLSSALSSMLSALDAVSDLLPDDVLSLQAKPNSAAKARADRRNKRLWIFMRTPDRVQGLLTTRDNGTFFS
jgi:hypothetical protein